MEKAKNKKKGRPCIDSSDKKSCILKVLMTFDEKQAVEFAAINEGLSTSALARNLILQGLQKK